MIGGTMLAAGPEQDGMTPEEFQRWYARLRAIDPTLTQIKLAEKLDVDQPRIGKWLRGEVKMSGYLWRALEHLAAELERERQPSRQRRRASRAARAAGSPVDGIDSGAQSGGQTGI